MSEAPSFTLYPAIDVLGGVCVRLHKGDYDAKTEYSRDPAGMAKHWIKQGAKFLHIVDLDGAKSGSPVNLGAITDAVQTVRTLGAQVQVGGGIRTLEAVERWLAAGVTRCVIGTAALDAEWVAEAVERFGPESIVVGLDGRNGKMAVRGWLEQTDVSLTDVAIRLHALGVQHALVTDVERDGTLQGANLELAAQIQGTGMQAIASGGVRHMEDVLAAKTAGLAGAIVGRSIYDGTLDLQQTIAALEE